MCAKYRRPLPVQSTTVVSTATSMSTTSNQYEDASVMSAATASTNSAAIAIVISTRA
jgi:hypothetical protein